MLTRVALVLIAALVYMLPGAAHSSDLSLVEAEGTATRADDVAEVKKKAMEQALRSAVLDAARAILAKESLSAPPQSLDTVASSARGYVLNYRIRSEGWITHMDTAPQEGAVGTELYHIWIDATIDTGALRTALSRLSTASGTARPVVINILGVRDYLSFRALFGAIEKVPIINDLSYGTFAGGRITLIATSSVDAPALAERLARAVSEDFAVLEGAGQIIIRPTNLVTR